MLLGFFFTVTEILNLIIKTVNVSCSSFQVSSIISTICLWFWPVCTVSCLQLFFLPRSSNNSRVAAAVHMVHCLILYFLLSNGFSTWVPGPWSVAEDGGRHSCPVFIYACCSFTNSSSIRNQRSNSLLPQNVMFPSLNFMSSWTHVDSSRICFYYAL